MSTISMTQYTVFVKE